MLGFLEGEEGQSGSGGKQKVGGRGMWIVRRKKKEGRCARCAGGMTSGGGGWKPHLRKFCNAFSRSFAFLPEVRHLAAPFA